MQPGLISAGRTSWSCGLPTTIDTLRHVYVSAYSTQSKFWVVDRGTNPAVFVETLAGAPAQGPVHKGGLRAGSQKPGCFQVASGIARFPVEAIENL